MYLIVIAWIYVVLMMSVAEATNSNGTLLGAIVTFFMYGVGPAALVAYLMGTPARKRAMKIKEADNRAKAGSIGSSSSVPPTAPAHPARPADDSTGSGRDAASRS